MGKQTKTLIPHRIEKRTMKACVLRRPAPIESLPLALEDVAMPEPSANQVLVRVTACGVCRTDLHVIEGELPERKLPVIPRPSDCRRGGLGR